MNTRIRNAMAGAAALLIVATTGCTDTTVEPKSTVTEANVFNDQGSYVAFIAKVYAGLARERPAGTRGTARHCGQSTKGSRSTCGCSGTQTSCRPTKTVIGWGDIGLPEMNTQTSGPTTNSFIRGLDVLPDLFPGRHGERVPAPDHGREAGRRGNVTRRSGPTIANFRAEARFLRALSYWHGIDFFGDIPLVTETDPLGGAGAGADATRAEVYNYIVQELTEIIPQPPAGRAAAPTDGRIRSRRHHAAGQALPERRRSTTGTAHYAEALTRDQRRHCRPLHARSPAGGTSSWPTTTRRTEIIFAVTQDGKNTQTGAA